MKRNRLKALGAVVVLALGSSLVWSLCIPHRDQRLEAIRTKGYPVTLAELDAWYPAVAPAENVALVYTNAFALLSGGAARPYPNFLDASWPLRGQPMTADEKRELAELLAAKQDALRLLYSAPETGRSRYPIDLRQGSLMLLPHLAGIRGAVQLLTAEALVRASEGDGEKATQALLAAGRVADSVVDEPLHISFLVRVAAWHMVCARLERVVGLTELTDDQLARLERLVADAERPPGLFRGLVGERVWGISIFPDHRQAQGTTRSGFNPSPSMRSESFRATVFNGLYRATGLLQRDKGYYLDSLGRQIAAAELPYPARFAASEQAAASLTKSPSRFYMFSRMLLPALARMHGLDAEHAARLRAATMALAVERFRRAHGNALPGDLAALTPTYLAAVPVDPFDGKPLRFARHGASYAVYSIGSGGKDNGVVDWNSLKLKNPREIAVVVEH